MLISLNVSAPCFAAGEKPNIIFILTDDLSRDLIPDMLKSPHRGLAKMVSTGTIFSNYFVTNSLCCPSRTSIFTGKFPHNTGVWTNTFNRLKYQLDGGFGAFQLHQNYKHTFALALKQAGYKTAMMGKYLNGYLPTSSGSIDPADPQYPEWRDWGWDEWDVADYGYREFNYDLNQNGLLRHYGSLPQDYLTDVISQLGQNFIQKSASGPFFIEISTFAPHAFYTPAPRDQFAYPGAHVPITPKLGWLASEHPEAHAPDWLKDVPSLKAKDLKTDDNNFKMRLQSDLAIDKMISDILVLLKQLNIQNKTYVFFSSDNGYHMGEYSLPPGKLTPFEVDIHVPLVVSGPNVPRRQVTEVTQETDLAPTFTDLAGLGATPAPTEPDGRSLLWALSGAAPPTDWRTTALIEHHGPPDDPKDPDIDPNKVKRLIGNPPNYEALRLIEAKTGTNAMYVEYNFEPQTGGNEIGYYDLTKDPDELLNIYDSLPAAKKTDLHRKLLQQSECSLTTTPPCP